MATVQHIEDLEIWQLARELTKLVYKLYTVNERFAKDYKLKDQINDSSGSVMDNIAEGFERGGNIEFVNFLSIAKGALGEVKSQIIQSL
jgi:four helix bundle protein